MSFFHILAQEMETQIVLSQPWWPYDTEFELFVGAILTQNTQWHNVSLSLKNLKTKSVLSAEFLLSLEEEELQRLIRPSGFQTAKARYLRAISQWYIENKRTAPYLESAVLRNSLLSISGVGEETADALLLYAYKRPLFIWDLYARRLLSALGLSHLRSYRQARMRWNEAFESAHFDAPTCQALHARIVEAGKLASAQQSREAYYQALCPATHQSILQR